MKTKIWKTFLFFATRLLPLCWMCGFVVAMFYQNDKLNDSFFMYISIRVALIVVSISMAEYMKLKEIKGWYAVVCELVSIGVFVLSMLVYVTS